MTITPELRKGTAVWIRKDGHVLIGLRNNVRGNDRGGGTWCPPGGHVETGETDEDCALREVREEARVEIKNLRAIGRIVDFNPERNITYDTACFVADWAAGVEWQHLPEPLYRPAKQLVEEHGNPLEI
jgi:8-oxo-dGTP diphosphatase